MNKFIALALITICTLACSKKDSATGDTTDDTSVTTLMQSAATTVGEAFQGEAQNFVPASGVYSYEMTPILVEDESAIHPLADCSTVAYSACSSGVRTRNLNGCSRTGGGGNTGTFYGTVTLTFDANATCTTGVVNAASGSVTRTLSNYYGESSSGYKVLAYTSTGTVAGQTMSASDLQGFNGVSYSGGTTLAFTGANTRTLTINGVHRRGMRSSGALTFWHTVFTSSPLSVSVASGSYTVASGTVTILHNRASISVANTFTNVTYPTDGSCCYPTSGTITTTIGTGTPIVTTFTSTCGAVSVGSISTNLPACGGTSN